MCKHCERLKEDKDSIPIVHAFFEDLTKKVNRKLTEEGRNFTVTANDLDIKVEINKMVPGLRILDSDKAKVLKMLNEMDK